jgi:hypothetical protein
MALFPRTEPEIATLALVVKDGLVQAAEHFPAPPVPAAGSGTDAPHPGEPEGGTGPLSA